ncbi:MAG TPA: hypothetical protein VEN79_10250 [Terriglobia bacterium]|nr:hypothetical protein [Terriglobia bacterium]
MSALAPNDDMVLETAVNGNADAIVTFNQRDFEAAVRDYGDSNLEIH